MIGDVILARDSVLRNDHYRLSTRQGSTESGSCTCTASNGNRRILLEYGAFKWAEAGSNRRHQDFQADRSDSQKAA